jgi:hypothetical protein
MKCSGQIFLKFVNFLLELKMLRRAKSSSAIAKGDSNTPASSRKIYTFSKWLTQNDQVSCTVLCMLKDGRVVLAFSEKKKKKKERKKKRT